MYAICALIPMTSVASLGGRGTAPGDIFKRMTPEWN